MRYPEIVRLLIENGANLEKRITWHGGTSGTWIIGDDATALHFAASDGIAETIKLLIDSGVDIFATTSDLFGSKATEQTALDVAASFGRAENAEAITNHPRFNKADPDLRQRVLDRCLITGSFSRWLDRESNRPNLFRILLNAGANPNATDEKDHSAIQVAARSIHLTEGKENKELKVSVHHNQCGFSRRGLDSRGSFCL